MQVHLFYLRLLLTSAVTSFFMKLYISVYEHGLKENDVSYR